MSLLWIEAAHHEAAKPIPTKDENLAKHLHRLIGFHQDYGDPLPHEQTPQEFGDDHRSMWHGSPNGIAGMKIAHYGVHVGSHLAAKQALEARIGRRADGEDWDGTQEYGKTLLGGYRHGYGADAAPDTYPSGRAEYSGGHKIPLDVKPHLFPVRIIGGMTNLKSRPHPDWHANGYMQAQIKQGRARNGYFYKNEGEGGPNEISAVVPSGDHLATHEDFVRHAHGREDLQVPQHNLDRYGL